MNYEEDEYLMLSGIQHFQFCKRQWALIHIEQQWIENEATTHGKILHTKADNPLIKEKRRDSIISRAMRVSSKKLGLYGVLDVVEFHKNENGIPIAGRRGRWLPVIVEYKRGRPKKDDRDIVQLVAQTMCLEETLDCRIEVGYLYYHSVNQKVVVDIDTKIRNKVTVLAEEMHKKYKEKKLPKAEYFKNCKLCSLVDVCMPRISKKSRDITHYMKQATISEEVL